MGFFSRLLLQTQEVGFFSRWASLRDSFANSRGGLLFEMGFFTRWATFRDSFANSRGGLLFKRSAVVIETDDYKIMSKTTTQMFQPRNMLKCQIVLKKITNFII